MTLSTSMQEALGNAIAYAIIAVIGILYARASGFLRKRPGAERWEPTLQSLRNLAAQSVRTIEQTVVADLKDPTKPGRWDQRAAQSAKSTALNLLNVSGGALMRDLLEQGWSQASIDTFLHTAIEDAVNEIRMYDERLSVRRSNDPTAPAETIPPPAPPAAVPAAPASPPDAAAVSAAAGALGDIATSR